MMIIIVEWYNRSEKKHLGGYDPKNRNRRISKPVPNRRPNGGWHLKAPMGMPNKFNLLDNLFKLSPQLRMLDIFVPIVPIWETNPYSQQQIMI